jgi:hypothetical protein
MSVDERPNVLNAPNASSDFNNFSDLIVALKVFLPEQNLIPHFNYEGN